LVIADSYRDPSPFLPSDKVFNTVAWVDRAWSKLGKIERYWDGTKWVKNVKDALTWELYETAVGVAQDVRDTVEHKGEVHIQIARLETTIEILGVAE
jgi:hypothetical protein